ncbi:MAG: deoxyribose-phosphate aldolase, partial [Acidobacteriota bacterium]
MARYIDHTLLKAEATRTEIEQLCDEARSYQFASVCVNPTWVREAAVRLLGSSVKVCTVVGFPLGATLPDVKAYETRRAIFDGATEIDMVINIGALKSGDDELVRRDIAAVVASAHEACAIVKVILETALLTDEEKIRASRLAQEAGADFVKTSTGFSRGGATVADIELMRKTVGVELGVKAAGGVKDLTVAREMIAAGATRIGASAGVRIVQEAQGRQPATTAQSG